MGRACEKQGTRFRWPNSFGLDGESIIRPPTVIAHPEGRRLWEDSTPRNIEGLRLRASEGHITRRRKEGDFWCIALQVVNEVIHGMGGALTGNLVRLTELARGAHQLGQLGADERPTRAAAALARLALSNRPLETVVAHFDPEVAERPDVLEEFGP